MAGIVLWRQKNLTTEKFNHKGHEGTRSSYSIVNIVFFCRKEPQLIDWERETNKGHEGRRSCSFLEAATSL
jgi:hypothetical protein